MWSRIISIGLVMGLVSTFIYDLMLPGGLVSGLERGVPVDLQFETARTTVFTALVMMQLFNALNSRADVSSAFSHLFTNKWLWLSLAFGVVSHIAVVEIPFLQSAFGTTSLDLIHWAIAVGAGVVVLLFEKIVKLVRRSRARAHGARASVATAVQARCGAGSPRTRLDGVCGPPNSKLRSYR